MGEEKVMDDFFRQFDRGVFVINVLAIIKKKNGEVLIGRRQNDPYIKKLSWSFPGGRPAGRDELEEYLKIEVRKKTGYQIEVGDFLFAKTYPEDRRFLSIYYSAEIIGGQEKAGEKFSELKWVLPEKLDKYFTTSLNNKLLKKIK